VIICKALVEIRKLLVLDGGPRIARWLKIHLLRFRSPDQAPFEILMGTTELRKWLRRNQRLTLIGEYQSRLQLSFDAATRRRILIRAQADIGKTREALSLIEAWVDHHLIADDCVILVPKNGYSVPDLFSVPPATLTSASLGSRNVILLMDDLPVLCTDPGIGEDAGARIERLVEELGLRNWSTFLVVATGRTTALGSSMGHDYANGWLKTFDIHELRDFSLSECHKVLRHVAAIKRVDVSVVSNEIVEKCGASSAENIVQLIESCRLHAALATRVRWWNGMFGTPLSINSYTKITANVIQHFTKSSAQTWRALVYIPAEKNYPELAALYKAATILNSLGIYGYLELLVDLAASLLVGRPFRWHRIQRALQFLAQNNFHFVVDETGRAFCPDVVYEGVVIRDEEGCTRAAGRTISKFSELPGETTGRVKSNFGVRILSAGVAVWLVHLFLIAAVVWIFPGELHPTMELLPLLGLFSSLYVLLLLGARFDGAEPSLLIFFGAAIGIRLILHGVFILRGEIQITYVLFSVVFSCFLSGAWLLFSIDYYHARTVRQYLWPEAKTLQELRRQLRKLNFRSFDRFRVWINPLLREHSNLTVMLWMLGSVVLWIVLGSLLRRNNISGNWSELLRWLMLYNLTLPIAILAYYRSFRYRLEGLLVSCTFYVIWAVMCGSMWGVKGIDIPVFIYEWYLGAVGAVVLAGWIARGDSQLPKPNPLLWESVYPSQRNVSRPILSGRFMDWLIFGSIGLVIITVGLTYSRGVSSLIGTSVSEVVAEERIVRLVWETLSRSLPNNAMLHYRIGAEYMLEGEYGRALAHVKRANQLRPDHLETLVRLAQSSFLSGNDDLAQESIGRALRLFPPQPGMEILEGQVLYERKEYQNAIKFLGQLIVKGNQYRAGWAVIGSSMIEVGDCSIADDLLKNLPYTSEDALLAKARCLRATGNITDAMKLYTHIINLKTVEPLVALTAKEHFRVLEDHWASLPRRGALVVFVLPHGEAKKVDLKRGDIIIGVEGREIRCANDLIRVREQLSAQKTLTWQLIRSGVELRAETGSGPLGAILYDF